MENINKLAREIYEQNKAVGWWDDPDRCIFQTLQLVSTEIAEATEGVRKNLMDDHLPHRKMEEVELADALVRVLDVGGRYEWEYCPSHKTCSVPKTPWRILELMESPGGKHAAINVALAKLIRTVFFVWPKRESRFYEYAFNSDYSLLIDCIIKVADDAGYDIFGALREKLEYNKQRADHKRENRAKEGGKTF